MYPHGQQYELHILLNSFDDEAAARLLDPLGFSEHLLFGIIPKLRPKNDDIGSFTFYNHSSEALTEKRQELLAKEYEISDPMTHLVYPFVTFAPEEITTMGAVVRQLLITKQPYVVAVVQDSTFFKDDSVSKFIIGGNPEVDRYFEATNFFPTLCSALKSAIESSPAGFFEAPATYPLNSQERIGLFGEVSFRRLSEQ